jgi:hypothetical protein
MARSVQTYLEQVEETLTGRTIKSINWCRPDHDEFMADSIVIETHDGYRVEISVSDGMIDPVILQESK